MTQKEKEQWLLKNDMLIFKIVNHFVKQSNPNFEDFLQEGRLRAFIALGEYKSGEMSLQTYVFRCVHHRIYDLACYSQLRNRTVTYLESQQVTDLIDCIFLEGSDVSNPVIKFVLGQGLYDYLLQVIETGVDDFQKESIIEWLRGYTAKDIAQRGRIPVNAVQRNIREVKPMLREIIQTEWYAS